MMLACKVVVFCWSLKYCNKIFQIHPSLGTLKLKFLRSSKWQVAALDNIVLQLIRLKGSMLSSAYNSIKYRRKLIWFSEPVACLEWWNLVFYLLVLNNLKRICSGAVTGSQGKRALYHTWTLSQTVCDSISGLLLNFHSEIMIFFIV